MKCCPAPLHPGVELAARTPGPTCEGVRGAAPPRPFHQGVGLAARTPGPTCEGVRGAARGYGTQLAGRGRYAQLSI